MLEDQGVTSEAVASVAVGGLVGVASDGRDLASLLTLAETRAQFDMIVETQLQDVARHAAATAIAAHPQATGYVRMVNPGACSRCVVMAGKLFRWNDGFGRHPRCQCRHVPTSENTGGDFRTDPAAYFDSLSKAEQDKVFTQAGADSIRMGADMGRVVNARRGIRTAQIADRPVSTTVGSTSRRGGAKAARVMPETILTVAADRDDALRLLRLYGYITT